MSSLRIRVIVLAGLALATCMISLLWLQPGRTDDVSERLTRSVQSTEGDAQLPPILAVPEERSAPAHGRGAESDADRLGEGGTEPAIEVDQPIYVTHLDRALEFARSQQFYSAAQQAVGYQSVVIDSIKVILLERGDYEFFVNGRADPDGVPDGAYVIYGEENRKFVIQLDEFPELPDLFAIINGKTVLGDGRESGTVGTRMDKEFLDRVVLRFEEAREAAHRLGG